MSDVPVEVRKQQDFVSHLSPFSDYLSQIK